MSPSPGTGGIAARVPVASTTACRSGERPPVAVACLHVDPPLAGEPADPAHDGDAAILEPGQSTGVVPVAGDPVPRSERRLCVRATGDGAGRTGNPPGGGEDVARPDQRLRRHAPPVGALAADQLALHDRHRQPAFGAAPGGDLSGRPGPDHDHVE